MTTDNKNKKYIIESKGFNYASKSIDRYKKELEELKRMLKNNN